MPHETTLIATVAAAFGLAFAFGYIAARFRIPPLVGYLLAGIVVGPFTPGYVARRSISRAARGDRRHPPHVWRGTALLAARSAHGEAYRRHWCCRSDRRRNPTWCRRDSLQRMVVERWCRLRIVTLRREHGRVATSARGALDGGKR